VQVRDKQAGGEVRLDTPDGASVAATARLLAPWKCICHVSDVCLVPEDAPRHCIL